MPVQPDPPFVILDVLQQFLDGAVLAAVLLLGIAVFLAFVRLGRVRAPWANRMFLDPVDRMIARRREMAAEEEPAAPSAGGPDEQRGGER